MSVDLLLNLLRLIFREQVDSSDFGSLASQTQQGLSKFANGLTLHIYGHSMGASMALFTALLAIDAKKFKKIRVYLAGGVRTISVGTEAFMKENKTEIETYEIYGDPVPYIDEHLKFFNRLTRVSDSFGPLGYAAVLQLSKDKAMADLEKLATPGTQYIALLHPTAGFNPITAHLQTTYMSAFLDNKVFKSFRTPTQLKALAITRYVVLKALADIRQVWEQNLFPKYGLNAMKQSDMRREIWEEEGEQEGDRLESIATRAKKGAAHRI
ncbi:hypothetical protein N7466_008225 [Penicillium verhagenii]|uniref:uncharacterized protein n=1 Tax=Penicillium verhagenii TaxID=1562060 RepID=UPI002545996C|nr:uncharacterized protein N7466_008225 [Penicillium verhagenii]KAJ5924038.1 hypothetical protein N7466_008225 [Penicillium verhagenii]